METSPPIKELEGTCGTSVESGGQMAVGPRRESPDRLGHTIEELLDLGRLGVAAARNKAEPSASQRNVGELPPALEVISRSAAVSELVEHHRLQLQRGRGLLPDSLDHPGVEIEEVLLRMAELLQGTQVASQARREVHPHSVVECLGLGGQQSLRRRCH